MSLEKFANNCKGCRPVMIGVETGKVLPEDSPEMIVVRQVWAETTMAQREAFHNVTCLNSRKPDDIRAAQLITQRIQIALQKAFGTKH